MISTWIQDEDQWSEGLQFIQLMKNRVYHSEIRRKPYKALFGCKLTLGLTTSSFPKMFQNRCKAKITDSIKATQQGDADCSIDDNNNRRQLRISSAVFVQKKQPVLLNKHETCSQWNMVKIIKIKVIWLTFCALFVSKSRMLSKKENK